MDASATTFVPGLPAPAVLPGSPADGAPQPTGRARRRASNQDGNASDATVEVLGQCKFFKQRRCKNGAGCPFLHAAPAARASRPRRGQAGEAFRRAERFMTTPRRVATRADLVAALRASGGDAFRVKAHVSGCGCSRAADFCGGGPGLLAIPDSRGARAALRVAARPSGDARAAPPADRVGLEERLARILFPVPPVDDVSLKVNCAECLLRAEPNGAVAIVGQDADVQSLAAAFYAERTRAGAAPRVHDCAHAVAAAPLVLLRNAFGAGPAPRTRRGGGARGAAAERPRAAADDALGELAAALEASGLRATPGPPRADHHLASLLRSHDAPTEGFVLLIAYDDGTHWTLELPGGKHKLGESTWRAAVRETAEEALLALPPAEPARHVDLASMRCFVVDAAAAAASILAAPAAPPPPPPAPDDAAQVAEVVAAPPPPP